MVRPQKGGHPHRTANRGGASSAVTDSAVALTSRAATSRPARSARVRGTPSYPLIPGVLEVQSGTPSAIAATAASSLTTYTSGTQNIWSPTWAWYQYLE